MEPSSDLTAKDSANLAFTAYLLQDYEEVLRLCDRAIELNPNDWMLWEIQAESFHNLGFYDAAFHSYDQSLSLNPEQAEPWYFKAVLLVEYFQQYPAALAAFKRSLELNSEDWQPWHNCGVCLIFLNQLDEAIEAFERAIQLEPSPDSWYRKAEALVQQRQLQQAIDAYEHAIELEPDCGEFWYQRGLALVDLHQYAEARQSYDRAVALEPGYKYRYYNCRACYTTVPEK